MDPELSLGQGLTGSVFERAIGRATASRRIDGNEVELQFDGPSTFDAWIEAIDRAESFVHFENYILRDDPVGRAFREALTAKARQGVQVRVVYDWIGCWATPRRYWKPFREAGVEVRAFNPPSIRDPFGLLQRDHRKLVCVDGEVAFVGGFCVGKEWAGYGSQPPWRDTGLAVRGPAAAQAGRTFERIWAEMGPPLPDEVRCDPAEVPPAGETPVWVIEGMPWRTRVYRSTQLIAAGATNRLWITDPYFVAPRPVSDALMSAASDGVDVRVLVPARNNWPWVGSLSRGGYRSLLKAGVRIFEWQGPMIHAKTSVADGIWCRVGSSNLNAASLLGNWEIDLGVLDEGLARSLEGLFLADLASAVEIVLPGRAVAVARQFADGEPVDTDLPGRFSSLEPPEGIQERIERWRHGGLSGSGGWRLADLVRAGSALGDAIAGRRPLGREDRTVLGTLATFLLVVAVLCAIFPWLAGWTLAVVLGWVGIVIAVRAAAQARRARRETDRAGRRLDEVAAELEPDRGPRPNEAPRPNETPRPNDDG